MAPMRTEDIPLLRPGAAEGIRERLAAVGMPNLGETLLAEVARRAEYVARCVREADAVVCGDLSAATRLWLLLKDPMDGGVALPASVRDEVAPDRRQTPRAIDGPALLRLVAGVVRAANQPAEATAMLRTLGRLLRPLFLLELADAAANLAAQGDARAITTIETAGWAPHQREVMTQTAETAPLYKGVVIPVRDHDVVIDRPPFDPTGWRHMLTSSEIDQWDLPWQCPGGVHKVMSEVDRFGERYTIDGLSNPAACAGETITITGRNFGPQGRVSFPSPDPRDPAFALGAGDGAVLAGVEPIAWSDTRIDVVVPRWATTGQVSLNGFTRVEDPCATIDVFRLGNSVLFLGGLASVIQVSLAGQDVDLAGKHPPNLTPGDAVAITYHATGGPTAQVQISLIDEFGAAMWSRGPLPGGYGGVVLPVETAWGLRDGLETPRMVSLVFTTTSVCGATEPLVVPVSLSVPPLLTIEYVEVTQGVQGDLGDVLAGQGMPTVALKDTAVRVHLNCDRGGWYGNTLDKITGSLLVGGGVLAPTNVRPVVPDRRFISVHGLSRPEITNETLNFTIPAAWLTAGPHTLTVRVVCDDQSGRIVLGQNVIWTWVAKRALAVRALYLGPFASKYLSPNTSTGLMLDYVRHAVDYLPTPLSDIGIAAPVWHLHNHDLFDPNGWSDLLDEIENLWDETDEASNVRWLAIVPSDPSQPDRHLGRLGIAGRPGVVAIAIEDQPEIGAHELGHTLGLKHVELANGGRHPEGPFSTVDNGGFLRRAPFDVRTSTAIPLPAGDLMTYFEPIRMGISTWAYLCTIF